MTSSRPRYAAGVQTQQVFQPSARSTASWIKRSPLPPTKTGGRGSCSAVGRLIAPLARWKRPSIVHGPPSAPRSSITISTASASRASRTPGGGKSIPIASYSGSYQPAPSPTSSRPPVMRSSVASAFASTVAGRNASHSTRVPNRAWATSWASAPSVTIGS